MPLAAANNCTAHLKLNPVWPLLAHLEGQRISDYYTARIF